MHVTVSNSFTSTAWTSLLLDSMKRPADIAAIRAILGENADIIVVHESDLPAQTIRRLLQSNAANILAVSSRNAAILLAPLLRTIASLASFRRVVLLHDMSAESACSLQHSGILLLRDCPEIRSSLASLVAREQTCPDQQTSPISDLSLIIKESAHAYRFPAALK